MPHASRNEARLAKLQAYAKPSGKKSIQARAESIETKLVFEPNMPMRPPA